MIVCSCNQLTERQVLDSLTGDAESRPRSPGQVHRCLGCKPDCGRCMRQIRQMFSDIANSSCQIGCAVCPGEVGHARPVAGTHGAAAHMAAAIAASTPAAQAAFPPQAEATSSAAASSPAVAPWQAPASQISSRRQFVVPAAQRFVPGEAGEASATRKQPARKLPTQAFAQHASFAQPASQDDDDNRSVMLEAAE